MTGSTYREVDLSARVRVWNQTDVAAIPTCSSQITAYEFNNIFKN